MQKEELQLIEARTEAEFQLSPIGQMVRSMAAINQVADFYSKSDFVPMTFKGKKENCAIAVDMAIRMNMNPIMVMQNMYVVHGQPSLSSKLIIAMINNCGEFEPLRFEDNGKGGDNFGYRAYTYRKSDKEHEFRLEGTWITASMVKKEGWGAKWQSMPEQMYKYRAAVFWSRTNAPEITMGILSREEVDEPSFTPYEDTTDQNSLEDIAKEAVKKTAPSDSSLFDLPGEDKKKEEKTEATAEPEAEPILLTPDTKSETKNNKAERSLL